MFVKLFVAGIWVTAFAIAQPKLTMDPNTDRQGLDMREMLQPSADKCRETCAADGGCMAYSFVKPGAGESQGHCWLKSGIPPSRKDGCCISGTRSFSEAVFGSTQPCCIKTVSVGDVFTISFTLRYFDEAWVTFETLTENGPQLQTVDDRMKGPYHQPKNSQIKVTWVFRATQVGSFEQEFRAREGLTQEGIDTGHLGSVQHWTIKVQ